MLRFSTDIIFIRAELNCQSNSVLPPLNCNTLADEILFKELWSSVSEIIHHHLVSYIDYINHTLTCLSFLVCIWHCRNLHKGYFFYRLTVWSPPPTLPSAHTILIILTYLFSVAKIQNSPIILPISIIKTPPAIWSEWMVPSQPNLLLTQWFRMVFLLLRHPSITILNIYLS